MPSHTSSSSSSLTPATSVSNPREQPVQAEAYFRVSSEDASAAPARSRYGREYKRSRPFTPPNAARAKRQQPILASHEVKPEPPQPLDFEDILDDDSDVDPQVASEGVEAMASSCVAPVQSGVGFHCPFEQCKPSALCWLSIDGVVKHLLQVHVRAGQHPPPAFLHAIGRWECTKCEALHSIRSQCPRALEPEDAPAPPPDAT